MLSSFTLLVCIFFTVIISFSEPTSLNVSEGDIINLPVELTGNPAYSYVIGVSARLFGSTSLGNIFGVCY